MIEKCENIGIESVLNLNIKIWFRKKKLIKIVEKCENISVE